MNYTHAFAVAAALLLPMLSSAESRQALQVRYEWMEWREFGDNGRQLLEESGPRVGLQWDRETGATGNLGSLTRARVYLGDLDYDGQNQVGQPVESTTEYHGILIESAARLPIQTGRNVEVAPFAGAGGHTWMRRLDDTGGFADTGYDEWWIDLYLQAGLDLRKAIRGGSMFVRAGVRYPFYLRAEYDLTLPDGTDDAHVEPDAEWCWFGEAGYQGTRYTMSLFYEVTTYGRSDDKKYGPVNIFQPDSEQQLAGIQVGVVF